MTSTSELITGLQTQVSGLAARLTGLSPNPLIYAALGDAILYGCKVTEGSDNTDYTLLLDGEAAGDSAFLNPDVSATPQYPFQFPNIATLRSGAFYIGNTLTVTVEDPPSTGTARYDIIYIFLGPTGPGIGVATGTPSAAVKTDFDNNGLDTAPYGSGAITDPAIAIGSTAVARVYVEDVYTGVQNARIADLRQKLDIDALNVVLTNPDINGGTIDGTVIGGTTPAAITGTDITSTGSLSQFTLLDPTQAVDSRKFRFVQTAQQVRLQAVNDAEDAGADAWVAVHNANSITTIVYGNSTDNPDHLFYGGISLDGGSNYQIDEDGNRTYPVTTSITAGSTQTQAGATALTNDINNVTTVGTTGDGVKLPSAVAGRRISIHNNGANALQVWPNTGDTIDGGAANAVDSNSLAAGGHRVYEAISTTAWYTA
jgi:hypothetical protein